MDFREMAEKYLDTVRGYFGDKVPQSMVSDLQNILRAAYSQGVEQSAEITKVSYALGVTADEACKRILALKPPSEK